MIYLDTHIVVWLYIGESQRFSRPVQKVIEENDLLISPAVLMELQYLIEIDRLTGTPREIRDILHASIGLNICELAFPDIVNESLRQIWTRDPFDRLIVSQAAIRNSMLVTKDTAIRQHYSMAYWE